MTQQEVRTDLLRVDCDRFMLQFLTDEIWVAVMPSDGLRSWRTVDIVEVNSDKPVSLLIDLKGSY